MSSDLIYKNPPHVPTPFSVPNPSVLPIMIDLVEYLYVGVVCVIRGLKWGELQVLRCLKPWLRRRATLIGESVGVVFHYPNEDKRCVDKPVVSKGEEERILGGCGYDRLCHVKVLDSEYFVRVANGGTLACGEAFMDQIVDVYDESDYVEYAKRVLENDLLDLYWNKWNKFLEWLEYCAFNLQTKDRAFQVGKEHYDLGNDLYERMLDPWMQYTCGYWAKADNLNDAQVDKMELIAKKLDLKPGMRVLDIGCGWGTLCKYLAENYGVECVGVTISKQGVEYGRRINKGLNVDIRLMDYRDVNEVFDRVVSIGCMEHVGVKNYRGFFEVARRCLKDDGVFLCHTIGRNHVNFPRAEGWLHKYIFPNGQLPDVGDMERASRGLFVVEDWHNFGLDYARTLREWRGRFFGAWGEIGGKYGGRFYRMWVYYLCVCEASFLARRTQLWQVVFSKDGLKRGYRAAR